MSKIKIQGNASGTGVLTVTAPNTSTDRTITLPDFTGTLLTSTVRTATNEEDAILIEQSDGADIGSLRINNGSFIIKGKHTSNPVQIQTHDGNEDIEVDPDGFIKFETGGSERMRVTTDGLTFNGDTASANALDDYEDGTWTPTLNNTGGTPSYTWQNGHYAKIGNFVWLTANVKFTVTPSGATQQAVGGLPFASKNTGGHYFGAEIHPYQGFNYNNDGMMAQIFDGSSIAYLYNYNASTTYNRGSVLANMIGTTIEFKFTAFYTTT
jgi:hypothetical protein